MDNDSSNSNAARPTSTGPVEVGRWRLPGSSRKGATLYVPFGGQGGPAHQWAGDDREALLSLLEATMVLTPPGVEVVWVGEVIGASMEPAQTWDPTSGGPSRGAIVPTLLVGGLAHGPRGSREPWCVYVEVPPGAPGHYAPGALWTLDGDFRPEVKKGLGALTPADRTPWLGAMAARAAQALQAAWPPGRRVEVIVGGEGSFWRLAPTSCEGAVVVAPAKAPAPPAPTAPKSERPSRADAAEAAPFRPPCLPRDGKARSILHNRMAANGPVGMLGRLKGHLGGTSRLTLAEEAALAGVLIGALRQIGRDLPPARGGGEKVLAAVTAAEAAWRRLAFKAALEILQRPLEEFVRLTPPREALPPRDRTREQAEAAAKALLDAEEEAKAAAKAAKAAKAPNPEAEFIAALAVAAEAKAAAEAKVAAEAKAAAEAKVAAEAKAAAEAKVAAEAKAAAEARIAGGAIPGLAEALGVNPQEEATPILGMALGPEEEEPKTKPRRGVRGAGAGARPRRAPKASKATDEAQA